MPLIMVVDDSPTERAFCCGVLRPLGLNVVEFDNGEDAVANVRNLKPDLIILDVVMPKLNGYQTCRKIKRDEATKDIPVIMLTSKGESADKAWGMRQGAELYLVKPTTEEALLGAVRQYIKI